jgi:endogenous inhibitor of DNA gyrase (YacG/DUF329 family)
MVLTRQDLNEARCPDCGSDHVELYLGQACHPQAGLQVMYDKRSGVLTVTCHECGELVSKVEVAASRSC